MLRSILLRSTAMYGADDEGKTAAAAEEKPVENTATDQPEGTTEALAEAEAKEAAAGEEEVKSPFNDPVVRKELGRKHRQIKEKDDELELLRRQNQELQAKVSGGKSEGEGAESTAREPGETRQEFESRVQAEAERIANERESQRQLAEMATKGNQAYGEKAFESALENLKTLGGFDPETMMQIMATGAGEKVLFELGSKPEHYQRIMELPFAKRAVELTKLAIATKPKTKATSEAPAPVDPIGSGGTSTREDLRDEMTDGEFYAMRAKQKRDSIGRPWSTRNK